ncbi:MAG: SoxR reducing system RseC family protein [Bacteroides sp.]
MEDIIKHQGIVESIDGSHISVRIVQTSACAACSAKGHCSSADSKDKLVDVYSTGNSYQIGEEVMIYGTTSMGLQAVFIAFVIPFIILISMLFVMMSLTQSDELLSALFSIATLIPYYILIYVCRNRLKKKFSFTLKPINN